MKNWREWKKYFKLNSMRRTIILGATLLVALLAIVLGSTLYTTKSSNVKKSTEYASSYEYVVKVSKANSDKTPISSIAEDIYNRIDPIGLKGLKVTPYEDGSDEYVKIIYPNIEENSSLKDEIANEITHKPQLTLTTDKTQPIFDSHGNANTGVLMSGSTIWGFDQDLTTFDVSDSVLPISGAKVVNNNGILQIHLTLNSSQISSWYTAAILLNQNTSNSSSTQPTVSNKLSLWFDLDGWIDALKNTTTTTGNLWSDSSFNPYNALYTNNDPSTGVLRNHDSFYRSDASDYRFVEIPLTTNSFSGTTSDLVIKDGFDVSKINDIVNKINFSTAKYELAINDPLKDIIFHKPSQGTTAFRNFIIWASVVFSLIAIALMVNYGLLGALATISLALFTFITLSLFTVMRGEYSPEAVAALIVGIGLSLDMNIVTFERLKNQIYLGQNLKKADQTASKKSSWTIIDSNVITLLLATILFYFGTKSIIGFSITLVITILLTFVVTTLFTKFTSALLLRSGYFDNKLKWLGVHQSFDERVQVNVNKVDFVKTSKWPFFGFIAIIFAGVLTMIVFAAINKEVFEHVDLTNKIIVDAIIAVSIAYGFILTYTLVRFRWTYTLTLLYASLQDILLIVSLFAITRFTTSPAFVAALLGVLAFSLCDKLTVFDRLREKIKSKQNIADLNQIKDASNEAVRLLFRRTFMSNGLIILAITILLAFTNIVTWQVGITLLIGMIINFITSIFVLPMIWTKLEIIRQKGIARRIKNNFWDIKGTEEQTIVGINDYKY